MSILISIISIIVVAIFVYFFILQRLQPSIPPIISTISPTISPTLIPPTPTLIPPTPIPISPTPIPIQPTKIPPTKIPPTTQLEKQLYNIYNTVENRLTWIQSNVHTVSTGTCVPNIPFPPTNININSFYKNTPCKCEQDPVLYATYQTAMTPITSYKNAIINTSNNYLFNQIDVACFQTIMNLPVQNKSFLGTMQTTQSTLEKMFFSITFMIVYTTNYKILQSLNIESYIASLVKGYETYSSNTNNLKSWYILAKTYSTLISNGNLSDIDALYTSQCNQINNNGTIDSELARGIKSSSYHAYFMLPLIIVTFILYKCSGSTSYNQPKLHLLLNYILACYFTPISGQVAMEDISPWFTLYTVVFGTKYIDATHLSLAKQLVQNVKITNTSTIGNIVYTFVAANSNFSLSI